MKIALSTVFGLAFALIFSPNACALCADVTGDGQVSSADALVILTIGVGQAATLRCSCDSCGTSATSPEAKAHCADVTADGQVTALDALAALKISVGQAQPFGCSCTACEVETTSTTSTTTSTTTSSTTTTTSPACPQLDALDERTYVELYTCAESPQGGDPYCAHSNASASIRFTHVGSGDYQVRNVPDTGLLYNGTLACRTFEWNAVRPGEYTAIGTWAFSPDLSRFAGSSTYAALDASYAGECSTTGAESPTSPTNPTPVPPCP